MDVLLDELNSSTNNYPSAVTTDAHYWAAPGVIYCVNLFLHNIFAYV